MSNETVTNMQAIGSDMPPDESKESVHYRVIADEELLKLEPLFTKLGWALPDPNYAKVVVVEAGLGEDAIILGFGVIQFVPHAEPFWIHPTVRGTWIAEELMANVVHYIETDSRIKRYVAVAKPGSFGARLCEANGMVPFPGQLYTKQVPDPDPDPGTGTKN